VPAYAEISVQQLDCTNPFHPALRAIHINIVDKMDKHQIGRDIIQDPQEIEMGQAIGILIK